MNHKLYGGPVSGRFATAGLSAGTRSLPHGLVTVSNPCPTAGFQLSCASSRPPAAHLSLGLPALCGEVWVCPAPADPSSGAGPGTECPRLAFWCLRASRGRARADRCRAGPARESGAGFFPWNRFILGPPSLLLYMVPGLDAPELGGARARGRGSPVLLPRVTPAGVGLPQLGGEHPDDVDEEDEVELRERGRAASRGCSPAGRGARTRGPTALPGLCSAAASPGGSLGPQVPHLDQDGDRLPLRPCGCDPGVQGSFYWSPSGPRPWGREPTPPPSPVATLLTTMEARMGTWMIHFLFPELKSQHLGEVEASAPSPPVPALSLPTEMPQSWSSLTLLLRTQDRGVSGVARPEAALRGLF